MKNKIAVTLGISLVIVIATVILIRHRLSMLFIYERLISEHGIYLRIQEVPSVDKIQKLDSQDTLSLGYVNFSFPKDKVYKISYSPQNDLVSFYTSIGEIGFMRPFSAGVSQDTSAVNLSGWPENEEMISAEIDRHKQTFITQWRKSPYAFKKQILETVPSPFFKLLLLSDNDLFDYVYRLQWKAWLTDGSDYLFEESDLLKAIVVTTQLPDETKTDIKVFHGENFRQFIVIKWKSKKPERVFIDTFISSLTYAEGCEIMNRELLKKQISMALTNLENDFSVDISFPSENSADNDTVNLEPKDIFEGLEIIKK